VGHGLDDFGPGIVFGFGLLVHNLIPRNLRREHAYLAK
jgi:hypothetical protein